MHQCLATAVLGMPSAPQRGSSWATIKTSFANIHKTSRRKLKAGSLTNDWHRKFFPEHVGYSESAPSQLTLAGSERALLWKAEKPFTKARQVVLKWPSLLLLMESGSRTQTVKVTCLFLQGQHTCSPGTHCS